MEGVHDRGGIRHNVSGSFLIAGEGIHSDVVDAVTESIGLVVQPVGEDVGGAAGDDVEQACRSVGEVDDDSHPPVDAAVGPAVLIDTDCGYTLEPGGISDEQRSAEVEYSRAHSVPGGSEVLSDDVDAHLVDDHGLQCPQACCRREFRSAGAGSLKCLGPALVAGRAGVGADANSQGHRGQADRGMNEFADPGGPDESASTADRAGPVVVGDQAQHGQMPTSVVLPDRGESEFRQGECGIEAGRGKVVHEGPWVVMES